MATRNRTAVFLQYRASFSHSTHSHFKSASIVADGYGASEKTGLIAGVNDEDHHIDMGSLPPRWVDIVEEIEDNMNRIKEKVSELESLYKKHLLEIIEDRSQERNAIEIITDDISELFRSSQRKIKQIDEESRTTPNITRQEQVLCKNIQVSLATRLQNLTGEFRKSQSSYLQKLRQRQNRTSNLFTSTQTNSSPTFSAFENPQSQTSQAFNDFQLATINQSDTVISERETQINEIAKSIFELAELFKDLQNLVIEQGTMLDRIDYNIENTNVTLKEANKELDKGAQYQKSATKKQCIFLLILVILGLIIALAVKKRR
ncbi:t-SNARE [Paraphysoderma sedebokerense]|nr:t-SNARE [Paraphysoderma sedebokerense]KAI9146156.1 t-SNARE [Paraphysoderma sedebokerense]